jgi:RecB family endonuclease NucS
MIGCCRCNLNGKTESEIYRANECIYDPKGKKVIFVKPLGYFIIRGVEKVLLI